MESKKYPHKTYETCLIKNINGKDTELVHDPYSWRCKCCGKANAHWIDLAGGVKKNQVAYCSECADKYSDTSNHMTNLLTTFINIYPKVNITEHLDFHRRRDKNSIFVKPITVLGEAVLEHFILCQRKKSPIKSAYVFFPENVCEEVGNYIGGEILVERD